MPLMRSSMSDSAAPELSVSIVSHGHVAEVRNLLSDLRDIVPDSTEILLTLNSAADAPLADIALPGRGRVIRNSAPKGFGANHNAAFGLSRGKYFCVVNPDIRLPADPFQALMRAAAQERVGIVAPRVVDSSGAIQTSYRRVPTPALWLRHALGSKPDYDYANPAPAEVDWFAGMFMLFRREVFESLGGFDERYFLYYEDVDICCRARIAGWRVRLEPRASVIHDARRDSHRNLKFTLWHAQSVLRFWLSATYRRTWTLPAK